MPDNMTWTRRRVSIALAAVAATIVAIGLALELLDVAPLTERHIVAPSGGLIWGGAVLAGLIALTLALLAARRSAARALGIALAVAAMGELGGFAWHALAGTDARFAPCHTLPRASELVIVEAETYVDGALRNQLEGLPGDGRSVEIGGVFADLPRAAAEDLGIEELSFGRMAAVARHCRALVSGSHVTGVLPALTDASPAPSGSALAAAGPLVPAELPVWRGDFDWWISSDEMIAASFHVGGHPADAWPVDGLRGELRVRLVAPTMIDP